MLLAVGTLCLMAGCSSKVSSSKGIVSDATMNTVTIVTDKKDYSEQNREDKKWRGIYRMYLPKDDGSEKDSWSKRTLGNVIWSFEASNNGYHWDWNESVLKDKLIGVLFRNKEWEYNGQTGWTTECCAVTDIESIRANKYRTPKDKPLSNKTPAGFTDLSNEEDKDLPWVMN